jgi:molybdenum cofactor cytidylyltransferase
MGRDKALLPWPPRPDAAGTFLSAAIELLDPFVDIVMVVAGANQHSLAQVVYASGASLVVNPDPKRGQFSSLHAGLREVLNRGRDAAIITLVDRPPVSPSTVQTLSDAFHKALLRSQWSLVPEYQGQHGHPIFAGREMIEAFLRAPATSSAREVEHAHREKITYFPVNDPLVVVNIDTPEQYAGLPTPELPAI